MRLAFLGLVAGLTREREEEEPQSPGPPGSQARLREDVGAVPNHCGKAKIQMERGAGLFFFFFGSPVRKLQNHNKR